jgi:ABC-type thiamin/hydroxymethylpyrimidine transport system permease subunit
MPNNLDPSWANQPRRSAAEDVFWLVVLTALAVWIVKHWSSKAVRFITGAGIGYVVGLIVIGALFLGNQSPAAAWLTVTLAIVPAVFLGGLLARFAGKGAETRHQAKYRGRRA